MTVSHADLDRLSRQFMDTANRLPTFYDLGEQFTHLIDLLEDEAGDEQEIEAELHRLAGNIKAKAYGLAVVIQSLENLSELQAAEAKRLANKAKQNQAHADRLRSYALKVMQSTPGCERIEAGYFTLAVRLNPPSVTVEDASLVPSEFNRTKITVDVDKVAIKEHWKATGEVVPGVSIRRTWRLDLK